MAEEDAMKRFVMGGVFLEVALLIIGLTWIGPSSGGHAQATGSTTAVAYKAEHPNGNVVDINLTATETVQEIAPGVTYHVWTFDGTAPGPLILVDTGATVHFTLTN